MPNIILNTHFTYTHANRANAGPQEAGDFLLQAGLDVVRCNGMLEDRVGSDQLVSLKHATRGTVEPL